jgi:hypothetical protein
MISDFRFESHVVFNSENSAQPRPVRTSPMALQLPIAVPGELLNLRAVEENIPAMIAHFSPLDLAWKVEVDRTRGGARATAILEVDAKTGALWMLALLEHAGTGRHSHNDGGPYGECVITLAGELNDILDDGTAVKLCSGAVMFHAPNTVHEASSDRFWAGIYHQPRGCTILT